VNIDPRISRRSVLAGGAGLAGVAALAACASSGSEASAGGQTRPNPTKGESSAAGSSAPVPSTASRTRDDKGDGGHALATLDDIPVGRAVSARLPSGDPVVVARPTPTTARCFSAICTHMGCTVAAAGSTLDCPCHGSQFDALTGKVLRGPASSSLPSVPVKVAGRKVVSA
jgi:cytochrome b6-f complex iron-sulfur subunit